MSRRKTISPDEVHLRLDADADAYPQKQFCLELIDGAGRVTEVQLDGIQVADLLVDADVAGMPDVESLHRVGMHLGAGGFPRKRARSRPESG